MDKALFLDRDGTINIDYGYVHKIEDFHFIDGIFEFCKKAMAKGYKIIVITNQSGIERGYFTQDDFNKLSDYMLLEFNKHNIDITDIFFCPSLSSKYRKPNSAMFINAKEKHNIDMQNSVSIGDKQSDLDASQNAGVKRNFLFKNNYKKLEEIL